MEGTRVHLQEASQEIEVRLVWIVGARTSEYLHALTLTGC
jgi:hypothetical protein